MTAAEMYAAEKARRGIVMPRAEGCPRKVFAAPVLLVDEPEPLYTKRREARAARWAEWRKLYVQDGWGLIDIATQSACSPETVRSALRRMGVAMRPQGGGRTMAALIAENKRLKRDVQLLKVRLSRLRHTTTEAA